MKKKKKKFIMWTYINKNRKHLGQKVAVSLGPYVISQQFNKKEKKKGKCIIHEAQISLLLALYRVLPANSPTHFEYARLHGKVA